MANPDPPSPAAASARLVLPLDFVPRRVVSLVPGLTESLYDLHLGSRLVGVSDDCTRPRDQVQLLPRCGAPANPDVSRIAALHPDLILADDERLDTRPAVLLRQTGVPVWAPSPRTVFHTLNLLWALMDVFDHAVMVPRVREIERAYDYTAAAAGAGKPVRVFAALGSEPWATFNRETYAHDVLRVCGGANVFAEAEARRPTVTLDDVAAAQPDVALVAGTDDDLAPLKVLAIPAADRGAIYSIDGSLLTWYGTRVAYALRDLPRLLMGGT